MGTHPIDLKSLAIGFLMGICVLMAAARAQDAPDPAPRYEIATASTTWVINKATGDVWQLDGEHGSSAYTWTYAGKPTCKARSTQDPGKSDY